MINFSFLVETETMQQKFNAINIVLVVCYAINVFKDILKFSFVQDSQNIFCKENITHYLVKLIAHCEPKTKFRLLNVSHKNWQNFLKTTQENHSHLNVVPPLVSTGLKRQAMQWCWWRPEMISMDAMKFYYCYQFLLSLSHANEFDDVDDNDKEMDADLWLQLSLLLLLLLQSLTVE